MEQSIQEWTQIAVNFASEFGLDLLGAIAILVIGWTVAGWAKRGVARALGRVARLDETLRMFFASLVYYFLLAFTVLAVLSQFGIQTASLLAVFGAAGLAIGLALQGTLSDVAAGVLLLIFRPFKIGDYVEVAGQGGTIKSLTLFLTELATPDNVQILLPNSQIWGTAIKNYSFHSTRRVDLVMGIDYGDDINLAVKTVTDTLAQDERCMKDPEPLVAVNELADSSVNLVLRVWCRSADYWPLKFDLTKMLKERFDAAGLTIPFPQQTVHYMREAAE